MGGARPDSYVKGFVQAESSFMEPLNVSEYLEGQLVLKIRQC